MSAGYKQALQRFEDAVRAHETRGAQHTSDRYAIEVEYVLAKQALIGKLQYRRLSAIERGVITDEGA